MDHIWMVIFITSDNVFRSLSIDAIRINCGPLISMLSLFQRTFSVGPGFGLDSNVWTVDNGGLLSDGPQQETTQRSRTCSIHCKNCEISGPYNFWTPVRSNILDAWDWNSWTLFGSEIDVAGGHAPLTPQWLHSCGQGLLTLYPTYLNCSHKKRKDRELTKRNDSRKYLLHVSKCSTKCHLCY